MRERALIFMLSFAIGAIGALPPTALCIADDHDSHLVFGTSHDHHHDGDTLPHDDDDPYFCGHDMDHPAHSCACGDGDCLDVPLSLSGEVGARNPSPVAALLPAREQLDPDADTLGAAPDAGGGPAACRPLIRRTNRLLI